MQSFHLAIPGEIEMTFLNYGGIIQSLKVPDKNNNMIDVVLGFDNPHDYERPHPYFGALVGRYANRINKGTFSLDGKAYYLAINNPPNSLHGGVLGFDRIIWEVEISQSEKSFRLHHISPDTHEGYPGNLNVDVSYTLTSDRELIIGYAAQTDHATPVNLSSHCYFNLSGKKKTILSHKLWINADKFTEVDKNLIPTGELRSVRGPMDFRIPKFIESTIYDVPGGYDHNYVLKGNADLAKARLLYPPTGVEMEVFTTEPGLQFYSGNFLDGSLIGKGGESYQRHQGLCLETQHFPDSPSHNHFPNTILRPGEKFSSQTTYKFSTLKS